MWRRVIRSSLRRARLAAPPNPPAAETAPAVSDAAAPVRASVGLGALQALPLETRPPPALLPRFLMSAAPARARADRAAAPSPRPVPRPPPRAPPAASWRRRRA